MNKNMSSSDEVNIWDDIWGWQLHQNVDGAQQFADEQHPYACLSDFALFYRTEDAAWQCSMCGKEINTFCCLSPSRVPAAIRKVWQDIAKDREQILDDGVFAFGNNTDNKMVAHIHELLLAEVDKNWGTVWKL